MPGMYNPTCSVIITQKVAVVTWCLAPRLPRECFCQNVTSQTVGKPMVAILEERQSLKVTELDINGVLTFIEIFWKLYKMYVHSSTMDFIFIVLNAVLFRCGK